MTEPSLPDRLRAYDPARPDPGLRYSVLTALGYQFEYQRWYSPAGEPVSPPDNVLTSLDFAFSQIPAGWCARIWQGHQGCVANLYRPNIDELGISSPSVPHPAVALLLAILAAREIDAAAAKEATP